MEQPVPTTQLNPGYQRLRRLIDRATRICVQLGGIGVVFTIILIMAYLLIEVMPLFRSAELTKVTSYDLPGDTQETLYLTLDETGSLGVRLTASGLLYYFQVDSGKAQSQYQLPIPEGVSITAKAKTGAVIGLGLSDGGMMLFEQGFAVRFEEGKRIITPKIEFPLGETPLIIDPTGAPLAVINFNKNEDQTTVAAITSGQQLMISKFTKEKSFFDEDEAEYERSTSTLSDLPKDASELLIDANQRLLYVANQQGELDFYDINATPKKIQRRSLTAAGVKLANVQFLTGSISLLATDSTGTVSQWFPVRDGQSSLNLQKIRSFSGELPRVVTEIATEERRKGFLVASDTGHLSVYHTTAHRELLTTKVAESPITNMALSPRANLLLLATKDGQLATWKITNEHPDISWDALWNKVWYESYDEPDWSWQSSSASNDFEPKFSFTPLAFGTLKAAFYAMLFAVPLAIGGAIYTGYFMRRGMRNWVKPTVEIMAALPTVILGFLAGLWLAPFMEEHLPGIFSLLVIVPTSVLLMSFGVFLAPRKFRSRLTGWEALAVAPALIFGVWLSIELSAPLEIWLFNGDMRIWLEESLGVGFDQRNSLVVGVAMGIAVIPTIFSITEDAVISVPRQLTFSSLALGATPWQTLSRVVILTASPGIFSAVMIGLGRAVGETMIVLMATGNTPIMDFNIFQGMRTFAANIAVEMPEAEVASTHFRVLFLAALVLFLFTFVVNTLAEIVRQRLREKYSNL